MVNNSVCLCTRLAKNKHCQPLKKNTYSTQHTFDSNESRICRGADFFQYRNKLDDIFYVIYIIKIFPRICMYVASFREHGESKMFHVRTLSAQYLSCKKLEGSFLLSNISLILLIVHSHIQHNHIGKFSYYDWLKFDVYFTGQCWFAQMREMWLFVRTFLVERL